MHSLLTSLEPKVKNLSAELSREPTDEQEVVSLFAEAMVLHTLSLDRLWLVVQICLNPIKGNRDKF